MIVLRKYSWDRSVAQPMDTRYGISNNMEGQSLSLLVKTFGAFALPETGVFVPPRLSIAPSGEVTSDEAEKLQKKLPGLPILSLETGISMPEIQLLTSDQTKKLESIIWWAQSRELNPQTATTDLTLKWASVIGSSLYRGIAQLEREANRAAKQTLDPKLNARFKRALGMRLPSVVIDHSKDKDTDGVEVATVVAARPLIAA